MRAAGIAALLLGGVLTSAAAHADTTPGAKPGAKPDAKPVASKPTDKPAPTSKPKASKPDELAGVRVVYAHEGALWSIDARGKSEPTKLFDVGGELQALRSDPAGAVLAYQVAGVWRWAKAEAGATPTALPCTEAGGLALSADGEYVVCGATAGTQIIRLASGKAAVRPVPSDSAMLVGTVGQRRLVWGDAAGVWSAPAKHAADLAQKVQLAPAPLRGLSIGPGALRALGVFEGVQRKGKTETKTELLYGFALDGTAARRKSIREGKVLQWSADGVWALVQDGSKACVMRVVGGEYKCWKGFAAVALSPDGTSALLLGSASASDGASDDDHDETKRDPGGDGEGGSEDESDGEDDDGVAAATISGERALYRAIVPGTYTERPTKIVAKVAGAATWLPAPGTPVPTPVSAPPPKAPAAPTSGAAPTAAPASAPTASAAGEPVSTPR